MFQGVVGYRSLVTTAIVSFLIAVFLNPLRSRIQALVDRALFKGTPVELAAQREQLLTEVRKGDQMKAVATLAAGLAHEIRNPLTSIRTFVDYLDERHADPEFREKFKRIAGGELGRIDAILQRLLDFSKPAAPTLAPVAIQPLIDETLEFLQGEIVRRHVQVQRSRDDAAFVLGDTKQLKQVFLNVFLNSLQAMNGDGRLEIQTTVEGHELQIRLADNGVGIDPKDLPHIFEPFFSTKPTGTGLGLAVVHGIVKEHGGRISVESHPTQGTVISLFMPLAG